MLRIILTHLRVRALSRPIYLDQNSTQSINQVSAGWHKNLAHFLYALKHHHILTNFQTFFHCQEKICNNTITKDSTAP